MHTCKTKDKEMQDAGFFNMCPLYRTLFNNDQQVSVETEVKGQLVRNGRSAKINFYFLGTQGIYIYKPIK